MLLRVEAGGGFGAWSYEAVDTKLSRETRAGTILQLGLYSEMLGVAQGRRPEHFQRRLEVAICDLKLSTGAGGSSSILPGPSLEGPCASVAVMSSNASLQRAFVVFDLLIPRTDDRTGIVHAPVASA